MEMTATEFKAKCLKLIDRVGESGDLIVISKHGRPVARLVPECGEKPWLRLRGRGALVGDPFVPVVAEEEVDSLH